MSGPEFTLATARAAAAEDRLGEWVREFLASPGSDNAELGEILDGTCWAGPVLVPLDELHRMAGPPGHPVLQPVAEDEWRDDVADLADDVEAGDEVAPVVAVHEDGRMKLEDGNHRVEALRRAGEAKAWTVVGFSDEAARDEFIARAPSAD